MTICNKQPEHGGSRHGCASKDLDQEQVCRYAQQRNAGTESRS